LAWMMAKLQQCDTIRSYTEYGCHCTALTGNWTFRPLDVLIIQTQRKQRNGAWLRKRNVPCLFS